MGGGDTSTQSGRGDRTEKQLADEWRKEEEEEGKRERQRGKRYRFSQIGTHIIS